MRWLCLSVIEKKRPDPASRSFLLSAMISHYPDVTEVEMLRNLDYLVLHALVVMTKTSDTLFFQMTGLGVDVVEFNADCPAGIARLNE